MNRYFAFLTTIAFSITMFVSSAHADPKTGSLIDKSRNKMTGFHDPMRQKTARAAINTIARCKAENNRFRANKTLGYRYLSDEQTRSLNVVYKRVDYDEDNCFFNKRMSYGFSTAPVVGAFSEFFLTNKYGQDEVDELKNLTDLDWQQDIMKPRNANELFGSCVVRSGRDKIYTLINTIPDTEQELEAIRGVVPLLGSCVTEGLEVSFDKTSLRAILAYGLFRAVHQHQEMLEATK